jgi:hypothetical protein
VRWPSGMGELGLSAADVEARVERFHEVLGLQHDTSVSTTVYNRL